MNGLLFVNPSSRTQVYLLAGFGWARDVTNDSYVSNASEPLGLNETTSYHYFGGQAGVGLEYRVSRNVALNVDLRGFIRGRMDNNGSAQPEFIDPATGKTTNTSGGLLMTGGMTFYF